MRTRRELTQEQLAEKAGVDYKHFQLLEIGRSEIPSLGTVRKIAEALGTKPWVLICDDLRLVCDATGLTRDELATAAKPAAGRPRKKKPSDA